MLEVKLWIKGTFQLEYNKIQTNQIITVTILNIIHRPVFYLKHMKGNVRTSLEAPYVSTMSPTINAFYRFVTIVY
jgi:hypothetical protein